mgnify:FL=1
MELDKAEQGDAGLGKICQRIVGKVVDDGRQIGVSA